MRRTMGVLFAVAVVVGASTGCDPAAGRYRDLIFAETTMTTVVYRTAPDVVTGAATPLSLDVYQPVGDALAARPVLVFIHGGGFRQGSRAAFAPTAQRWARRGFVTVNIQYRVDAGNRCYDLWNGRITDPAEVQTEMARCIRIVNATLADAQASLRWVRSNAAKFRLDGSRVAVVGSSAGANIALNVAQRSNAAGAPAPADVAVDAALSMSGFQANTAVIDAADPPISLLASGGDGATPFHLVEATADRAASAGNLVERIFYPDESSHANQLYAEHQAEVDALWSAFLIDTMDL